MRYVEVATQAELDRLKPDEIAVVRSGRFVARGNTHVVAWGNTHVVARDNTHVVARGNTHVVARGNTHVVAWGNTHVVAWDNTHVDAAKFVATHRLSTLADVTGGVIIDVQIDTPQDWCDFHGIPVTDGKAVLFKAVEDDWKGGHKKPRLLYKPGATPKAPDWDPVASCGGGLHLSPHPRLAKAYCDTATHFLACEVDVESMVLLDDKVKVPSCRVLHEVTVDAKALAS